MLYPATRQYISDLSDEQLLEYLVVGTREYEMDAVEFAQQEFQRRKIPPEKLQALASEAQQRVFEKQSDAESKAEAPLSRAEQLFWFALGLLNLLALALLLVSWIYAHQGAIRKASQMQIALLCGFVFESLLIVQFMSGWQFGLYFRAACVVAIGFSLYVRLTPQPKPPDQGFEVLAPSGQQKNSD